jgi:hypothetical protein
LHLLLHPHEIARSPTYEEDLVALQVEVAALGFGQHLHWEATRMLKVSRAGRLPGVKFDFHDT